MRLGAKGRVHLAQFATRTDVVGCDMKCNTVHSTRTKTLGAAFHTHTTSSVSTITNIHNGTWTCSCARAHTFHPTLNTTPIPVRYTQHCYCIFDSNIVVLYSRCERETTVISSDTPGRPTPSKAPRQVPLRLVAPLRAPHKHRVPVSGAGAPCGMCGCSALDFSPCVASCFTTISCMVSSQPSTSSG
jgi:hypothetical protein